jgi:hypothetical protein
MTPTAVGLVLVEGHGADGEIMDQAAFDVPTRRGATAISTSEYVAGAMSRTRAMANGHRPHAIGVTWSDESELEASLLLKSLTDAGFDNVVAVRSPEAGEALARGIGRAVGYQQTVVCLVEPEDVVVSMVDIHDGTVETVTHHDPVTSHGLIDWLSDVFAVNGWQPECLVVVGPDAGLSPLAQELERSLDLPVFAPPEAELALARGAALASAHGPGFDFGHYGVSDTGHHERQRSWPLAYTTALTMLVVGILAFVVSVSLVAGLKLTSNTGARTPSQQPEGKPPAPAVAQVAAPPAAPLPLHVAPPPQVAPVLPAQPSPPIVQAPLGAVDQLAAGQPGQMPDSVAGPAPDAAPPADAPPPEAAQPPDPAQLPAAEPPSSKPPLLTRILSRIPGLHGPDSQSALPADPSPSTPPGPPDGPPPPP